MKHPKLKVGDAVQFRDYSGSVCAAEVVGFTPSGKPDWVDCPNLRLESGGIVRNVGGAADDTVKWVWLPLPKGAEK